VLLFLNVKGGTFLFSGGNLSTLQSLKDRPILRAAIAAKVDALLTGDKDFLESSITIPKIMTAAEFLHMT